MEIYILEKKDLDDIYKLLSEIKTEIKILSEKNNPLLKPREVMERLNITDNVFYKMAREGKLPFLIKIGKAWRCKD